MMKMKRRIPRRTPEERAAQAARHQALLACIAKARAEVEARGEPIRDLTSLIERAEAERAARENPA